MLVSVAVTATDTHHAIDAVWRIEQAKLIAGLARMVRDVGLAEELAQDALVAALEQWPKSGIPDKPGAWLMAAAKHRAIDRFRRAKLIDRKHTELGHELAVDGEGMTPDLDAALDDDIGDDLLRLMFTACHPVLGQGGRVALTLRLIAGLTTDEIARAFLVPEPTVAQRIVRAKRTLAEKRVPFEVPRGPELAERLASVLSVIYLIFNEGYSATAGDDWMRPQLCEEALRLGRILAELAPAEPEVHGLVALMEIQASRLRRAHEPDGRAHFAARPEPCSLGSALDPPRSRRAGACRSDRRRRRAPTRCRPPSPPATPGPARGEETDWARIVGLYGELSELTPSPSRSSSIAPWRWPCCSDRRRGWRSSMPSPPTPHCADYHLLPSVRGDLLAKLGRADEARGEFERAAAMTRNARERELLLKRAAACANSP